MNSHMVELIYELYIVIYLLDFVFISLNSIFYFLRFMFHNILAII